MQNNTILFNDVFNDKNSPEPFLDPTMRVDFSVADYSEFAIFADMDLGTTFETSGILVAPQIIEQEVVSSDISSSEQLTDSSSDDNSAVMREISSSATATTETSDSTSTAFETNVNDSRKRVCMNCGTSSIIDFNGRNDEHTIVEKMSHR